MVKRKCVALLLLFSFLVFEAAASSSTGEHESGLGDFLGKVLNFLILFGGLAFVLAKPIKNYLQELVLSIQKTIAETRRAREEAEKGLEAVQKRLEGLEAEVQKIKQEGEAAGLAEREKILALARQEVERLRIYARLEIERHTRAAQRRLREHAADLAITLARARIEKRLTDDLHVRLIEKSIQGLGKLYEDTRPG